jgi:phospholipid/cholesterol/gamma-HCH transport system substrate-binding protein
MKESITGLSRDSSVKLRGVDIGKVSKIRINPQNIEKIEIFLKIEKGMPIKEDMVASTQMFGITGLLSINIEGGTNEAKLLKPTEDYIPIIKTAPSFVSKLSDTIGGVGDRLSVLLSKDNIETTRNILVNLEKVTVKAQELEDKAMVTLNEADITLKEFNTNFAEATADFRQIQKDFSEMKKEGMVTINNLKQASVHFNRFALKVEKSIDRGDYNLKQIFEPILVDIHILSRQLNDLSKELEKNPSDLLFKSRKSQKGPGE